MQGFLTRQRYRVATIYTDHFSNLSYVHLQKGTGSDETLASKVAFEAYAKSHGVTVNHYHCDNGRFSDRAFVRNIKSQGQTISFCGANAHFQNGKSEKRIRDLQDAARVCLIHAKHRWEDAITTNLVEKNRN